MSDKYPYRIFPAEKPNFSRVYKTHRFTPPIRQFSNRSDLPYGPMLDTLLSYERSLLRSFGSPGLRFDLPKKLQIFSGEMFPGETIPVETFPGEPFPGNTFPGKAFPRKTFPGKTFPGKMFPGKTFPGTIFPGKTWNAPTVFLRRT